jgi:hypothetical protein
MTIKPVGSPDCRAPSAPISAHQLQPVLFPQLEHV